MLPVDPPGGLLYRRDGNEPVRLRKLPLVYEGREGIGQGIGADVQVRPVLAHDDVLGPCIPWSPGGQELGHAQLVGGVGGRLRHGVVPAEGEVARAPCGSSSTASLFIKARVASSACSQPSMLSARWRSCMCRSQSVGSVSPMSLSVAGRQQGRSVAAPARPHPPH